MRTPPRRPAQTIPPGTLVSWTSKSAGVAKTKSGVVLAFVERGVALPYEPQGSALTSPPPSSVHPAIPRDAKWSHIRCGATRSTRHRYLVRVDREGKRPLYYGPDAAVVHAQNPDAVPS